MKYTLEDFKNKKIAVWVENEEEYRKFCIFARGLKWQSEVLVQEFAPPVPCLISINRRGKMIWGVSGEECVFNYRLKKINELKIKKIHLPQIDGIKKIINLIIKQK